MKKHYRAGEVGRSGKSKDRPAVAKTTAAMRFPVYLSNSILVLAGFILFAPLVTSNDFYYPDIFLKSILFRVAAQLMVLLYVVLVVLSPSHRPRFNRIICALLAYFGLMLISSLPWISVDAWSSWWGDFTRMGGMFTQLHLLAYFFVLAQTFKRERDWVALFTASLFFGILMGFSGLVQQLHLDYIRLLDPGDPRIKGATGNPIHFAAYMLLNLMIVLWFVGRKDRQDHLSSHGEMLVFTPDPAGCVVVGLGHCLDIGRGDSIEGSVSSPDHPVCSDSSCHQFVLALHAQQPPFRKAFPWSARFLFLLLDVSEPNQGRHGGRSGFAGCPPSLISVGRQQQNNEVDQCFDRVTGGIDSVDHRNKPSVLLDTEPLRVVAFCVDFL